MQIGRRTTALFKFFAATARARLVATYLGAYGLGGLSLGHGLAQRQPISMYLQHAVFNLRGQFGTLLRRADLIVPFGRRILVAQQRNRVVPLLALRVAQQRLPGSQAQFDTFGKAVSPSS